MSLIQDVTFDSLDAVQRELREWLGPDSSSAHPTPRNRAARDALVAVLIHTLSEEISDVRVRSQIQTILFDLTHQDNSRPSAIVR